VLAPHYSRMSIGAYKRLLEEAVGGRAQLVFVDRWGLEQGFVELLADRVRGTDAHVVFTAHSLPARILEESDPYQNELFATAEAVARAASLGDWTFAYQSESPTGEPWLGPDILPHLEQLRGRGVRKVLVCPIGFVANHLEIRWDLDTEAKEQAAELGMRLERIEMPNDDPTFVRVLAGIVRRALPVPSRT
jgi:ferrochelatase